MPQVEPAVLIAGVAFVVVGVIGLFIVVAVLIDNIGDAIRRRNDSAYTKAKESAMNWPTDVGGGW